ncbi:alpha/beta fold hydrolase [Dactylosporangium matsuzakiense]|uniref:alpha/beta fold hydrolase n=1 Tax=Dactylosporangium matsuzakiense TaxID=53360 RepID=UPI0022F334D3|nr:alpha/beta fold hydrolase [Dactylosporangium matsuzakiense]
MTRRRAAAGLLAADAVLHVFWLTGATWPFPDRRALSFAVLGFQAPFTPPVLTGLAVLLLAAAAALWHGQRHITTVVAIAAAAQVPLRVAWAAGFGSHTAGALFWWLNLLLYLPLCTFLAIAARTRRWHWLVPVAVAAAIAATAYFYQPGTDRYPTAEGGSHFVDTRVARFHYLREGEGPPLVLLPGGTASTFAWRPQLQALSAGHTVYVVDLPGQGYTEVHDRHFAYDLPSMEAAISAFLDAEHLTRVDLAGHSWSGGWALSFAQSHPGRVARLVLLASSGLDLPDTPSWELLKLPVIGELATDFAFDHAGVRAAVAELFVHKNLATPAVIEAMWRPLTNRENLRSVYALERGLDWRRTQRRMPATTQPALIVWGAQNTTLPAWQASRFAALMPHTQVHVLDGCGHAITLDCPDQVSALMRTFLS